MEVPAPSSPLKLSRLSSAAPLPPAGTDTVSHTAAGRRCGATKTGSPRRPRSSGANRRRRLVQSGTFGRETAKSSGDI